MKALWTLFWAVCRLRRGPEEMPYSTGLLTLVLLLDVTLGMGVQLMAEPAPLQAAIGVTLLAAASDALVLWGLLRFKQAELRYVQSLTAIYGADFILGLIALPLVAIGLFLPEKTPWLAPLVFAQMLLVGWNIGVRGFVYHRALAIGVFQGNMLSLALFFLNIVIAVKIFPELLPSPGAR